jgi:hypothetical protein
MRMPKNSTRTALAAIAHALAHFFSLQTVHHAIPKTVAKGKSNRK